MQSSQRCTLHSAAGNILYLLMDEVCGTNFLKPVCQLHLEHSEKAVRMWHFLFPPGSRPGQPDLLFVEQMQELTSIGHTASLCSDRVFSGGGSLSELPLDRTIVYRGWMATAEEYQRFENAVARTGATLLTNQSHYLTGHHLPNWYRFIPELTPETHVINVDDDIAEVMNTLKWDVYFLKDYVKSLKSGSGSIVRNPSEAQKVIAELKEERGHLEGGICIRKFESLIPESERRFFVIRGKAFSANESEMPAVVHECAKRIPSPFFSVDIVKRKDGVIRVVEIGDGQVSDLKEWTAKQFASIWST